MSSAFLRRWRRHALLVPRYRPVVQLDEKGQPVVNNRPSSRRKPQRTPIRMSAAGRTLSDSAVAEMTEAGARALFTRLRWPHGRCCPRCGCKRHYPLATRRIFKCSGCSHQFSVTSGTIWQDHKFSLKRILLGIYYFCQSPKGISSATLAMIMGTSPNSALIFTQRVREALFRHNSGLVLSGDIEIDGIYFSRYRRRPNIGRRSVPTLRSACVEGRCALTMVQRNGPALVLPVEGESWRGFQKCATLRWGI